MMKKRLIACGVCLWTAFCMLEARNEKPAVYKDAKAPTEKRVEDLLLRMTMEEKVLQLSQYVAGRNTNANNIGEEVKNIPAEIGALLYYSTSPHLRNNIQKKAMEESRLGIPVLFGHDVIHGFRTVYPISIAQACSWNPALVEKACAMAAREARLAGLDWTFSPMIDVARDPRWGRVSEGYGEDPYTNGVFAVASVKGYQGNNLADGEHIAACLKHYIGYGASEAGRDYVYTEISPQTLWDTYMLPYEMGVKAGAVTLMSGFHDISGVPASANHYTMREVLKGRWSHDGFVVSDWGSIVQLISQGAAEDLKEASEKAIMAGVDMDMMSRGYDKYLKELVGEGKVPVEIVDDAVRRILRLKFRLGLFENPYIRETTEKERFLQPEDIKIAEKLAEESFVLLKNKEKRLPLAADTKVAVIGPLGKNRWNLLGSWTAHGKDGDVVGIYGRQTNQKDLNTQQLQFVFEPVKNWTINIEGALRTENKNEHWEVLPIFSHDGDGNPYSIPWGSYGAGSSVVNEYNYKENYYSTNIYSDYFKQYESGHYFKVMAGFNAELYKTRSLSGQKNTLISNSVPTLNTATESPTTSGGYAHNGVAGFFGRINYNYKERYLIELNGRYDGSSRFINDKSWGFFPSLSVGWNIAREDFFRNIADKAHIDVLKLRGSWGQLGNTDTKDAWYPFYQTMPQGTDYNWLVNGKRPNYASLPGIVSSLKTWETIETWDIGLDWGLFNNRLTGSFDYFVRWTYDMIGPAPELSSVLGATPPKINNSDMKSYGFELELGWRDMIGDFSYGAKFTLADDQQKITRYPNENNKLSEAYYPGMMKGEIWGYETVGIAQSQEEMDAHLAKVDQSSLGSKWGAGDIMYKDVDGDGVISTGENTTEKPGDRVILGNNTPRFKYGITLDAAWKGVDFRIFLQGVAKRDYVLSGPYFWGANGVDEWQATGFKEHWDFWRPEGDPLGANTNAYYPRVLKSDSRNMAVQSRYIQNAAYCRIKNVQIGYTLPKQWTNKAGMSSVRVYVSGDNLLTFSHMSKIFDPEALESTYDANNGKLYPLQRTISVGLNVNF